MVTTSLSFKALSVSCVALFGACVPLTKASSLEDLLVPKSEKIQISSENANAAWGRVVETFRSNDMAKAVELGHLFMAGDLKPSAYQLLGVKVMVGLAGGAGGEMFGSVEDQVEKKALDEERVSITKRYNELNAIYAENDAVINRLTMNRKRPVKQGSTDHLECLECARHMDAANAELSAMKPLIEANKEKMQKLIGRASSSLKPQTLQLLDMLITVGEIEAAVAIANTYIRKVGNDFEIASKQQDLVRLQEIAEKATKVVEVIRGETQEMVKKRQFWEARDHVANSVAKVESLSQDQDLVRLVKARMSLDPLGVDRNIRIGDDSFAMIQAQTETQFSKAIIEFEKFKANYPDHPRLLQLETTIDRSRMNHIDEILASLRDDLQEVERKIDPVKFKLALTGFDQQKAENTKFLFSQRQSASVSSKRLLEIGVAPSDEYVVRAKLEGIAASTAVLDSMGLPIEKMADFAGIRAQALSLLSLF